MPFAATWMELEIVILSEVSQTEKDKYDIAYIWNLKNGTNEPIYKTEIESEMQKTKVMATNGVWRVEDKLGDWD